MTRRVVPLICICLLALPGCTLKIDRTGGVAKTEPAPRVTFDQSTDPSVHSSSAEVIERLLPSVVNVRVTSLSTGPFGESVEGEGQGSGVVLDGAEGIIVTNNHVVRGALEVEVVFNDGREMQGEVVGTSPENDLAVIKVDAADLPSVEIGSSSDLRLGDDVLAIGFPLGLGGPTVTKGIVSAKERTIRPEGEEFGLQGLLQTDAAINPGNSGGALIDASGRLVGINTAAASAAAAENIGFAIAIDKALPVVEEILSEPLEQRAWLGVEVATLDSPSATQLGVDAATRGAVIVGLFPGPARDAGLEEGDVIVAVGDAEVARGEDLTAALAELAPGDRTEIQVVSADGSDTVEVELAQRPLRFSES